MSFTGVGNCVIDANQAGNANWDAADQVQQTITVSGVAPMITVSGPSSFTVSKPGLLSFTETGTPLPALSKSGTLPAGLTFAANTQGTARISGTPKPGTAGNYQITVSAVNAVSTVSKKITITVGRVPTTLVITGPDSATAGQTVTLSATVTGGDPPTGTVTFTTGSSRLGISTLDKDGHAELSTVLPAGTDTVTASYSGDATFAPASKPVTPITIKAITAQVTTLKTASPTATTTTVIAPSPSPSLPSPSSPSNLASTGVPAGPLTGLAILLLIAGTALLTATGRRQKNRRNLRA